MKVLFVSSGNSKYGISPIVLNQGNSLKKLGVSVDYFTITGKGLAGYLKSIPKLYHYRKKNDYHIVHAHYSLSAFVASLSGSKPLVVSLMGSDVKSKSWTKSFIKIFNYFFWKSCIVKSAEMKKDLGIKNIHIIPNGVDFELHKPLDQDKALIELKWDPGKKHILFAADPHRPEKNYKLAKETFRFIIYDEVELHFLKNVPHQQIPVYFAASNVVLLTSFWEGSPNVIKEAMACNCPVVATDVGDIKEIISGVEGCYISSFDPSDLANKLKLALQFGKRTNGREHIEHLKEENIAQKIIGIYKEILNEKSS